MTLGGGNKHGLGRIRLTKETTRSREVACIWATRQEQHPQRRRQTKLMSSIAPEKPKIEISQLEQQQQQKQQLHYFITFVLSISSHSSHSHSHTTSSGNSVSSSQRHQQRRHHLQQSRALQHRLEKGQGSFLKKWVSNQQHPAFVAGVLTVYKTSLAAAAESHSVKNSHNISLLVQKGIHTSRRGPIIAATFISSRPESTTFGAMRHDTTGYPDLPPKYLAIGRLLALSCDGYFLTVCQQRTSCVPLALSLVRHRLVVVPTWSTRKYSVSTGDEVSNDG